MTGTTLSVGIQHYNMFSFDSYAEAVYNVDFSVEVQIKFVAAVELSWLLFVLYPVYVLAQLPRRLQKICLLIETMTSFLSFVRFFSIQLIEP